MGVTRTNHIFQEVLGKGDCCVCKKSQHKEMAMLPFYWGFEQVRGQLCALISGAVVPQLLAGYIRGVRHIPLFLMRTWLVLCLEERCKNFGGLPSGP